MKDTTKELRIKIDGLSQLVKELKPIDALWGNNEVPEDAAFRHIMITSKAINKAADSLLLSKAWLGKVLAELGTENPYKSGYTSKDDIKPTADTANFKDKISIINEVNYLDMNHIEKVDFIRTEIEKCIQVIVDMDFTKSDANVLPTKERAIARINAYSHLCEAKLWLGFELARIKNE